MPATPQIVRAAVAALVVVAGAALYVSPARFPSQLRYLAGYTLNTPDPITTVPVDIPALRRAAALLPARTTYALEFPPGSPQLENDLRGVAHLLFLPSLETADPSTAHWLLRYHTALRLPPGTRQLRSLSLGQDVSLVEIARA